ncbi:helix-turn-helix transcriptional regulator [Staphylococcus americanisciuri]|uniref:Helix-turn-helix domain-containing protein n=1 Tax=Staphylococcus americanisciuri TaxID=2973940 RepID=A0ABT2F0Y7_9STAP|nr:helix-turn-helix transcriptional regulator [Staphylococcus americanisciuri]MCS4486113.1 helix-turn-helix domain-containing protein [Staphylococcus americanisciuri]
MRGITIELLTQCQSETYRVLDEIQLLVSLDGILDIQHNGRSRHCYNHIAIINNLDIVQISNAQSMLKVCIPMHFFSKYHANNHTGYFSQDRFSSHTKVISLLKRIIKDDQNKHSQALMYDILKILFEESYVQIKDFYTPDICVNNKLLNNILQYMYDHLDTRVSLKVLSEHFYVSQSYISILFNKYLNYSFKTFFLTLKVGYSLHSLLTTNDTIQSIAAQYGFSNYSNYSKIFKSYIEISPADYRTQAGNMDVMLTVQPFDYEHFIGYLTPDNLSHSAMNITIDFNELEQPSYTHNRQLYLEVSNIHIYDAIQQMHTQLVDSTAPANLTLYFQDLSAKEMRFNNTIELNHFCQCIKSINLSYAFRIHNMKQFEAFDQFVLKPMLRVMSINPYIIQPEDFKVSLILMSHYFSAQEMIYIKQHMCKYLPHCQVALFVQTPFSSKHQRTIHTMCQQGVSFDYYCIPFAALIESTSTLITPSLIDNVLNRFQLSMDDSYTPIVLTDLDETTMANLWRISTISYPNKFLSLLLALPSIVSGIGFALTSSPKNAIAYYNQYSHQLPYGYINQLYQHFAGRLNSQTEHYLLHDTDDAYLLLLFDPYFSQSNITSYAPQTYNYQVLSAYTLSTQLVVTYTYDEVHSNVTNGISQDMELYYLPSKDVELIHQTFQLQPHVTVHNFFNKILHISLPPQQIKLIKIYKHKATKKTHIL